MRVVVDDKDLLHGRQLSSASAAMAGPARGLHQLPRNLHRRAAARACRSRRLRSPSAPAAEEIPMRKPLFWFAAAISLMFLLPPLLVAP
ncbi:MAG: hypothetical protein NVS9B10_30080 [Nevskia sp.]